MEKIFRILVSYLLFVELSLFSLFIVDQINLNSSKTNGLFDVKTEYIDSLLQTWSVDEKIGQLLIPVMNSVDVNEIDSLYAIYENKNITAVWFENTDLATQIICTNYFRTKSKQPFFIATGSQNKPNQEVSLPSALTIAAIKDEKLRKNYVHLLANRNKNLGVNLDFSLNLNKATKRKNADRFGSNKQIIKKLNGLLIEKLNENKIIAVLSHFNDFENVKKYDFLVNSGLKAILLNVDTVFPIKNNIETNYVNDYLYKKVKFNGLLLTDIRNKSEKEIYWERMLEAGVSLFVVNFSEIENARKILKSKIEQKIITEKELNKRIRKIWLAKKWTERKKNNLVSVDRALAKINNSKNKLISRLLYKKSINLIQNKYKLLPIKEIESRNFLMLNYKKSKFSDFKRVFENYAWLSVNSRKIKDFNNEEIQNYSEIIFIIDFLITKADSLLLKKLKSIKNEKNLILVNVAYPENLLSLNFANTLIQVYDKNKIWQKIVPQILFGGVEAEGRLPFTLNDQLAYNHNIRVKNIQRLAYVIPEELGFCSDSLQKIEKIVAEAIRIGAMPGCQILFAKRGQVFYLKSFGYQTYKKTQKVKNTDLYDLASITKVAATTLASMYLYEKDSIRLNDSIKYYLSDSSETTFKNNQIRDFFIHKSGLPAYMPVLQYIMYQNDTIKRLDKYFTETADSTHTIEVAENFYLRQDYLDSIWKNIDTLTIDTSKVYRYSDVNFNVIYKVIMGKISINYESFLQKHIYNRLGLRYLCFRPTRKFASKNIAPTQNDRFWRKQLLRGYVHDEAAALYGGVAGNAGLFSNANDLAILFQMLLNGGSYADSEIFKQETVDLFTLPQEDSKRGLGFNRGRYGSFGHTGFAGTCVWASKSEELIYVFLSNRIHPKMTNNKLKKYRIRKKIHQSIFSAICNKNNSYE